MYEDQKPGGGHKAPRPYTYHYDGAMYDGPDQYVSLLMTTDGVLESEICDGDFDDPSLENEDPCDVIEDDVGPDAPNVSGGIAGVKVHSETVLNSTGAPEPRGFIQVTHTAKNKADARVTVAQSVPELLVALPSLEEPFIQPVACEADLYDKWARLPRSDMGARSPIRPITVTSKGWSISQTTPQQDVNSSQTPTKTSQQVNVPLNEECKSLDGIIEHYNYMFPSSLESSNPKPNLKVFDVKSSHKESKFALEDSIENSLKITNVTGTKSNPVAKTKAPTQATNPPTTGTSSPDSTGNPSGFNNKKPGVQLVPHPAATASIDWPPDVSHSDKFLKMTRFWSWRPKAAVKWQKGVKSLPPSQLDKLDKNVKNLKREKTTLKVLPKKTSQSTNGSSLDAISGSNDKRLRPLGVSSNGRSNPLVQMAATEGHDNDNPNSRYRNLNLRGSGVGAMSETLQTLSKNEPATRLGVVRENSTLHRLPEHYLNSDYDTGKTNATPRLTNPARKAVGSRGPTTPQPRFRPRLNRLGEARSDVDNELKALGKRSNQRAAVVNDSDVPRVQFMDLNDLNTMFGQGARPVVAGNKPKSQKEDFRTIGLGLSGKSSDSKSVI